MRLKIGFVFALFSPTLWSQFENQLTLFYNLFMRPFQPFALSPPPSRPPIPSPQPFSLSAPLSLSPYPHPLAGPLSPPLSLSPYPLPLAYPTFLGQTGSRFFLAHYPSLYYIRNNIVWKKCLSDKIVVTRSFSVHTLNNPNMLCFWPDCKKTQQKKVVCFSSIAESIFADMAQVILEA